jgi:hypothetical protein
MEVPIRWLFTTGRGGVGSFISSSSSATTLAGIEKGVWAVHGDRLRQCLSESPHDSTRKYFSFDGGT